MCLLHVGLRPNQSPKVVLDISCPSPFLDFPWAWRGLSRLLLLGLRLRHSPVQPASELGPQTLCFPLPNILLAFYSQQLGFRDERREIKKGKPNSPFESELFELCIWGSSSNSISNLYTSCLGTLTYIYAYIYFILFGRVLMIVEK